MSIPPVIYYVQKPPKTKKIYPQQGRQRGSYQSQLVLMPKGYQKVLSIHTLSLPTKQTEIDSLEE
jgi:hypothetical protein